MRMRYATWKKTTATGLNTPLARDFNRKPSHELNHGSKPLYVRFASTAKGSRQPVAFKSPYASISESQRQKKRLDRDFFVSVLETSVTKRDTKGYMNKFVPVLERKGATGFKQRTSQTRETNNIVISEDGAESVKTPVDEGGKVASITQPKLEQDITIQESLYVALIKFRAPQQIDDTTLNGVGKTLGQLRKLGLISIVVVDCDIGGEDEAAKRQTAGIQANRIAMAIDKFDAQGARVIDSPIAIEEDSADKPTSPFSSRGLFIGNSTDLMSALKEELIPIIPSFGFTADTCTIKPVSGNDAVLALTRQLSGLQFLEQSAEDSRMAPLLKAAEVYRLIILDPLGGTPAKNRATGRHLFLNLEQEFQEVKEQLAATGSAGKAESPENSENMIHLANAELAKNVLSLLPPTSSAVITTPEEVATERGPEDRDMDWALVGTRRGQNPLIHSLLTDKPMHSSSLPSERFRPVTSATGASQIGSLTTLAKRGMPLTIYPDPRVMRWRPAQPGQKRLNLTDPCIDLPRLVHLIEDSFGRKLDVDHYLKRVNGNLAGIIIAGEYEGGAILTWERPGGMDAGDAKDTSRLVPYLDKFAVLRKSQGAGGVADIIFNAMVRDCFPYGVCWRSRKDNPVNKWYFERSRGSLKFRDMNWTMFWTTPELALDGQRFRDYESVCRGVEPSWADKKQVVD